MPNSSRTVVLAIVGVGSLVAAGAASAQSAPGGVWPRSEFCGRVQSYVASSSVRVKNYGHDDLESFKRNAPSVEPLTTHQYDWPDDADPKAARMISCKLLTADRIQSVHGPQSAGKQATCEQANRYTYQAVPASLTPEERARALYNKGKKVLMDRDRLVASVDEWYAPFEPARVESNGRLRLGAKALRADWNDPKLAQAPESARGIHFCHLVAPEYMRRLLLDPSIVLPGPPPRKG